MSLNFIDFYILYPGHPSFSSIEMIEDELARVIIQKYHMIIFTNKGDVMGLPGFGANLLELLHDTKFSAEDVEKDIKFQINNYISELGFTDYTLVVNFYEHPDRFEEYMVIDFSFKEYSVSAVVQ